MKKILLGLLLFFAGVLLGETIDISKSTGTDQPTIASLIPAPASPEVDANVTIEAVFNEALNPFSTRQSVRLKKLKAKKKKGWFDFGFGRGGCVRPVPGKIDYNVATHTLSFKPRNPLEPGFYEVSIRHLITLRPGRHMRIKPIVYRFYVPEVINGFKLPPEPDEKINNSALLGIDFNHNGIRDDVERLVITEEAKNKEFPKTQTAISLQYAWAWQKMIESPTIETRKYLEDASACQWYFFNKNLKNTRGYKKRRLWRRDHVGRLGVKLEDAIFNTKERILKRFEFNSACSGHIYDLKTPSIESCMLNIDNFGE